MRARQVKRQSSFCVASLARNREDIPRKQFGSEELIPGPTVSTTTMPVGDATRRHGLTETEFAKR
jgi:hypothetical protein